MIITAAVLAVLLVIRVSADGGNDGDQATATATSTTVTTPGQAADAAVGNTELAFLSHDQLVGIVKGGCASMTSNASTREVADRVVRSLDREVSDLTAANVNAFADVLTDVAPRACPDGSLPTPT